MLAKAAHHPTSASSGAFESSDLKSPKTKAIVTKGVEMVFQSGSQRFHALSSVDLDIYSGDVQLLMGPSGSGKTTLLSILGGILTPTKGSVQILDREITDLSRSELSRFRLHNIGFIFQEFNLFSALTAAENVELVLKLKGFKQRAARKEARELLEQVGLGQKINNKPHDLSGGQKQRVAIARALAGSPQLIMADEPTAALDSQSGHEVIALLRQLAKEGGRTVLMVTHDPRIIDVADRVAYLEDGKLKR
ncbi:ABC transporter ATP-binding protein [Oculatella sp. LEGE 06141]|nr:ABC transporter ATP-binding protein [Oculatella sp. LEGE 06141]